MKKLILIAVLFSINYSYSQAYMDSITDRSCECINNIPDSLSDDAFTSAMGICLMTAAQPYHKKLKKDYKIDFEDVEEEDFEKLGRVVGVKLVVRCPEFVTKVNRVLNSTHAEKEMDTEKEDIVVQEDISSLSTIEDPEANDALEVEILEGVITKIENDNFVIFYLRDETGKVTKFYWLTFVEADIDLSTDYQSFLEKKC